MLNSEPTNNNAVTKAYDDSLSDDDRNRRDISTVFNDQDNEFDNNKLTKLDSVTVIRNPLIDIELSNEKYVDDEVDKSTILRFNQTLQNYLEVSVGNNIFNLTKYDRKQIIDTTIKTVSAGGLLLPLWKIECTDRNNTGKTSKFL